MSELAVIPHDPAALDHVADPAGVMVALVEQARTMLAQATGMEGLADVIEWKSRAEAIRVYTQQKDMGHEAELSAAEIVRRSERRIGQLIQEGRDAGEIATERDGRVLGGKRRQLSSDGTELKPSATSILGQGPIRTQVAAMTDGVTDEEFNAAIEESKEEGNLSRANVVRKVKKTKTTAERIAAAAEAHPPRLPRNVPLAERAEQIRQLAKKNLTSPQIADAIGVSPERVRDLARRLEVEIPADAVFGGRFRKVDPNDVIDRIVQTAEVPESALALVAYSELDRDRLEEWVSSLSVAIGSLTTIKRNLKKELTRDQD
jgi:hypothetical protein